MTYAEEYPELDIMFDEKRNGRSLASVTSKESTTVKFWWICQQCHRPFFAFLTAVIKGQQCRSKGCPYCAHKRLVGGDSFAELHPDLMDEYDSDNTIDPFKVFPSDTNHANWVCRKNPAHKWEASFLARHTYLGSALHVAEYMLPLYVIWFLARLPVLTAMIVYPYPVSTLLRIGIPRLPSCGT